MRAVLRGEHGGRYAPRKPKLIKLDLFKKARLSARIDAVGAIQLPAAVPLREIRAEAYADGITQRKKLSAASMKSVMRARRCDADF